MTEHSGFRVAFASAFGFLGGIGGLLAGLEIGGQLGFGLSASAMSGFSVGVMAGIGLASGLTAWTAAPQRLVAPARASSDPEPAHAASESDASTDELLRLVRSPPKTSMPAALLLVGSFVLFLLLSDSDSSLMHLVILVAVLLFHEAGHALAMKAFGYRDVRVFFIPFFGAAASGTRNSAPGWREGVVLLFGPVPGILLGIALLIAAHRNDNDTVRYAARMLLFINAFNLLPVMPLDGGRLFELAVFGRHRVAEVALGAVSVIALAYLAISSKDYVLGLIAYIQYVGTRQGWRIATLATGPQSRQFAFPDRPEATTRELVIALSQHMNPRLTAQSVATRAAFVRSTIERAIAARNPLRPVTAASLLIAWVLAVIVALFAMFLSAHLESDMEPVSAMNGVTPRLTSSKGQSSQPGIRWLVTEDAARKWTRVRIGNLVLTSVGQSSPRSAATDSRRCSTSSGSINL